MLPSQMTKSSMKLKAFLLLAPVLILAGCASSKDLNHNYAELIEFSDQKIDIHIVHREWGGLFDAHGYIGYQDNGYTAGLRGKGPTFVDPIFQDNPPRTRCVGSITLDLEHKKVTISMRRVIPHEGKSDRTKHIPRTEHTQSRPARRQCLASRPSMTNQDILAPDCLARVLPKLFGFQLGLL